MRRRVRVAGLGVLAILVALLLSASPGHADSHHLPRILMKSSPAAGSQPAAVILRHRAAKRRCGRVEGTPLGAFNMVCRRARAVWRHTVRVGPPRHWTGANIDTRGGGLALLYPKRRADRVSRAISPKGINARKLGRVPLVVARVPYENH